MLLINDNQLLLLHQLLQVSLILFTILSTLIVNIIGKTYASYYAMGKVLNAKDDPNGICVYVAPTKALVNQVAGKRDLSSVI